MTSQGQPVSCSCGEVTVTSALWSSQNPPRIIVKNNVLHTAGRNKCRDLQDSPLRRWLWRWLLHE